MRDFLDAVKLADLVQTIEGWRETTMEAEDLLFYNCCEWEVVEQVSEEFPHVGVTVLAQALIVETIDLSDLS
jgi:hypothetical protein